MEADRNTGRNPGAGKLREALDSIVREHGPWTAHDITLAPGIQTLRAEVPDSRLRRVVQLVADAAGKPLHQLRILDLGCLEGQFAIEFALHGARVIAVEARTANLLKSAFAAEALGVADKVEFRQADVRELSLASYGTFDAVLCLGILYHLDAPDVMELVRAISEVCTGMAIIDTHLSPEPSAKVEWRGRTYSGDWWAEYAPGARAQEEEGSVWSSVGNDRSFLLTRASLCNLLQHSGFTSVCECLAPYEYHSAEWPAAPKDGRWVEWPDRATFVAVKGERQRILSSALTDAAAEVDQPERPRYLRAVLEKQSRPAAAVSRLLKLLGRK